MYEQGKVEEAEEQKQRLEQKQRDTRKLLESQSKEWSPRWFQIVPDKNVEEGSIWKYQGDYWENRGNFKDDIDLFQ